MNRKNSSQPEAQMIGALIVLGICYASVIGGAVALIITGHHVWGGIILVLALLALDGVSITVRRK